MWDLWWTKWNWDRFISEFFCFPLSISFHRGSPYSYLIWGWTTGLLKAAVQRYNLTPLIRTTASSQSSDTDVDISYYSLPLWLPSSSSLSIVSLSSLMSSSWSIPGRCRDFVSATTSRCALGLTLTTHWRPKICWKNNIPQISIHSL
jgi:hypothetical protein